MGTGIESKLDKSSKIIVACSSGGTMKPTQNLPEGQQSRLLKIFLDILFIYLMIIDYTCISKLSGN